LRELISPSDARELGGRTTKG